MCVKCLTMYVLLLCYGSTDCGGNWGTWQVLERRPPPRNLCSSMSPQYDRFHCKCYSPQINLIDELEFFGINSNHWIEAKSQFEFVPPDTEESEFLDSVDFGCAAFSVETVVSLLSWNTVVTCSRAVGGLSTASPHRRLCRQQVGCPSRAIWSCWPCPCSLLMPHGPGLSFQSPPRSESVLMVADSVDPKPPSVRWSLWLTRKWCYQQSMYSDKSCMKVERL